MVRGGDLKKDKELQLQKIRAEVDEVVDGLGQPIDEGIKETVVYLNALGVETSASCEGHLKKLDGQNGIPAPWVEIYPESLAFKNEQDADNPEIVARMDKESQALKLQLQKILSEFYEEDNSTPEKSRIVLWPIGYGYRFQSEGVDPVNDNAENGSEEKLMAYRAEMKRFTEFLEKKYFG